MPLKHLFLPLLLLGWLANAQAGVQVRTDSDSIRQGQQFQLIVEAHQSRSISTAPDFSPLQKEFRVLSNRSSFSTENRAGRTIYISRWTLNLSPRRAGELQIPKLQIKGEWSEPVTIRVQSKGIKADAVILKATLEGSDAYANTPIPLRVQLYYSIPLQQGELSQPQIDGLLVERIGNQSSYTEQLNQRSYQVVEQRYLLQAPKSGSYQLPPLTFNALDSAERPVKVQSKALPLEVQPLPVSNENIQLSATSVNLEQHWPDDLNGLRAGDSLTRTLSLIGQGVPAAWLPDLKLPEIEGVSIYPQPAELEQQWRNGELTSRKTIEYKLLMTQPGLIRLPPVTLHWWNYQQQQLQVSQLESLELTIADLQGQQPGIQTSPSTQESDPYANWQAWAWAAIALICALGWTLSLQQNRKLKAQLHSRQRPKQSPADVPTSQRTPQPLAPELKHNRYAALQEACELNLPQQAHDCLLDWGAVHWPDASVESLEDIQQLAKDPTLSYLLKNLEHHLDDPSDEWHGDLLLERVNRLRQQAKQQRQPVPESVATTALANPQPPTTPQQPPKRSRIHIAVGD